MDNLNQETAILKPRKEFRKKIREILASSLSEYKNDISEKAFNAAIKRAGKLLSDDLYVKKKKDKKQKKETASQLESLVM